MVERNAQVSIEYLIITGFALMLTLPLITLFYTQSTQIEEEVTASQADRIATEIVNTADEVYYMGEPAKRTLSVYMPGNVDSVEITRNKLIMNISSSNGDYQIVKWAETNLSGDIDAFEGGHEVEVEARFDDVNITE